MPTTTTEDPLHEDSWYDIPFYEGADDVRVVQGALNYTVAASIQAVHDFYLEVMPDLGYTLVTDALGGPQKYVAFSKDGTRTDIYVLPPNGGDGTEGACMVLITRTAS
jgi:hypothetical protein